jgi:hypothetical protein
MALFGRKRDAGQVHPRTMTASGMIVDLGSQDVVQTLAMTRAAWQPIVWNYRRSIGELGQALRMKANLISKVGFAPAYQPPGEDEPIILTGDPDKDKDSDGKALVAPHVAQAAIECLAQLPWEEGYGFTGRMVTGFDVPGEVWLHGYPGEDDIEEWKVRSTSEVVPSGTGGLAVITQPGTAARPLDPENETLIRLWVPDPEFGDYPDSPLRTLQDVCEDVILAGREIRAAAMSRIAANGILKVPNGVAMVRDSEPVATPQNSDFVAGFTAAMTAPINNEGHVSAVVPIMVTGDPEELVAFDHLEITRRTDESVLARQEAGLGRIADSIDLPREAMKGTIGEANHWSAWLIDAQTFDNHLAPGCRLIADSLTPSYFRRRLMAPAPLGWGLTRDEAMSVRVWYDASSLTRNTNRSADADEAMDRGAISYDAYLKAKGFDPDSDKAEEEDIQRLLAVKSAAPQDSMGKLLEMIAGIKEEPKPPPQIVQGEVVRPGLPPGGQQPPGQNPPPRPPGRGQGPARTIPQAPPGVAASAALTEDVLDSVKIIDSTLLADIDNALIEKIRNAAEAELAAALRKAGSKIKAQVQGKDSALAAQLKGADPIAVGALVGYDRLNELGLTEDILLAAAFAYLSAKFTSWSLAAIKQAALGLSELIALPLVSVNRLAQTMADRIPAAWKKLEGSLRARAMNALYGRRGDALPDGEVPDTIILPGDIRDALAEIGGQGGLAMGADVLREIDSRGERVGFTWRYGITPRERGFHPHRELAGQRFEDFDDPKLATGPTTSWLGPFLHPGDHKGCMCDAVYSWMTEEADSEAARQVNEESGPMHADRVLAQLDDAAGRTGTHSQRNRDLRDRMVEVQTAWLERRAPR